MQAIVLVGGEGTRLRPLTETVPKPALTLVDRPFLAYMIEWLAGHGVTEVVLACGFLPDVLREALAARRSAPGSRSRYVVEPERRGTAGAIRFAADELGDELDDRFLALNGDVLTDLDLTALLRAHASGGAGDDRPAPGRGLLRLRPGAHRRRRRGARVPREDRRARARRDQRRHLRAGALGARPDPARRGGLDRARRLPAPGRRGPARLAPRRLLDGHRHARALPAGELGHPRAAGGDPGRADRAGHADRSPVPRSPTAPRSAPALWSPAAAGSRPVAEVRDSVLLDGCGVGAGARVSGSILSPGVEVDAGAPLEGAVVGEGERVSG